ncbi:MAG: gliding motility-associated C-terminal domain-containing protein [Bacteroidetes bacterium]|nr:gliding motility-associated C-terminal domain-containing protein [Bacteroidota bacterium]MBL6943655.1 gliding motility-associated C-terminal domain-containing protein [Bacteroidales bacterium]
MIGKIAGLFTVLFSLIFAPVNVTRAQIICDISIDTPLPVCPDIYFELSVFEEPNLVFDWQKKSGNNYVSVGNESVYGTSIMDSTVFRVIVIDTLTLDTCVSDPFSVSVHQQINIEFDQLQLTCTNGDNQNGNTAKVRAIATGEFPPNEYHYFWDVLPLHVAPGDSSLVVDLKAHLYYMITVRDKYGCPKTDTVWTEAYSNPEVEIDADPDTAYLQNPFITYSFINLSEDSIPITNHFWWFSDTIDDPNNTSELLTPTYTYGEVGQFYVVLTVYNQQGCDTIYTKTVDVKPVKLFIPNVFTPGTGDNVNETFVITDDPDKRIVDESLSKFYVSSHLVVFNVMGRTVFEAHNYDNQWNGDNLPDGVYYFVLTCNGVKSTDVFKGSVTIIRGK